MSLNIILNSSNVVGNNKTQYRFSFSGSSYTINPGSEICVASIQFPFSFFNINSGLYNNYKLQIIVPLSTPQIINITFPNGYYLVSDLQNYLEQQMILAGFYLYNSTTGNNYYFLQISTSITYYANQILCFPVPTSSLSLPTGYNVPSNWIGYSPSGYTPQVTFPTNGSINSILGFIAGSTYPPSPISQSYNIISPLTPNLSTVNSLIIQCNLVNNTAMFPSSVLDSFAIGNTSFGSNINYQCPYQKWIALVPGIYQYLDLYFTDQNFNTVQAIDSNVMISLLIKQGITPASHSSIPLPPRIHIKSPSYLDENDS